MTYPHYKKIWINIEKRWCHQVATSQQFSHQKNPRFLGVLVDQRKELTLKAAPETSEISGLLTLSGEVSWSAPIHHQRNLRRGTVFCRVSVRRWPPKSWRGSRVWGKNLQCCEAKMVIAKAKMVIERHIEATQFNCKISKGDGKLKDWAEKWPWLVGFKKNKRRHEFQERGVEDWYTPWIFTLYGPLTLFTWSIISNDFPRSSTPPFKQHGAVTQKQHSLPKVSVQLPYYPENPTIIQRNGRKSSTAKRASRGWMSCHVLQESGWILWGDSRNFMKSFRGLPAGHPGWSQCLLIFSKNHYSFTNGTLNCSSSLSTGSNQCLGRTQIIIEDICFFSSELPSTYCFCESRKHQLTSTTSILRRISKSFGGYIWKSVVFYGFVVRGPP